MMNGNELEINKITVMLVDDHPMVQGGLGHVFHSMKTLK